MIVKLWYSDDTVDGRNRVPLEVGSLSHLFTRVSYIPGGDHRMNYAFPCLVAARYRSRLSPKDPATITLNPPQTACNCPKKRTISCSPNCETKNAGLFVDLQASFQLFYHEPSSTSPNTRTLPAEIQPLFAWTRDFLITIFRIEF